MKRLRARTTHEAGQEAVEFALILPLLLLVMFGVLDLGRAFHAAITITNAARVGARYGMSYPDDTSGIIAATQSEAQGSGIDLTDGATSTITVECLDPIWGTPGVPCVSGVPIRVTVTYNFSLIITSVLPDPNIEISRFVEMIVP